MLKLKKKIIAAVTAAVMAVSSIPSYAEKLPVYEDMKKAVFLSDAYNYAYAELPYHLLTLDYYSDDVSISNVYSVYKEGSNSSDIPFFICFALENDTIIGDMIIYYVDGSFNSTFGMKEYPEIEKALKTGEPIAFVADDKNIYMTDGTEAVVFSSPDEPIGEPYLMEELELSVPESEMMTMYESEKMSDRERYEINATGKYSKSRKYPAPFVANEKVNEKGICWAACIASKVRYEKSGYSNLTAWDVYSAVLKYNKGKKVEKKQRYQDGMRVYNMTPNTNTNNQLLSLDSLIQKSDNKNLVIMRLSGGEGGHAIIFAGCVIWYDAQDNVLSQSKYKVMDPNYGAYQSVTVNANIVNGTAGFTYPEGSNTYTWIDSMYEV